MKKVVTVLLMCLGFITSIYSQSSNLTLKFKKYIPQSVASKYIFMNSLDSKIIEIGKLDPRLLYSYLKNLDENWNKKLEIDSSNNINMFAYNLNVTLQSRSDWYIRTINSNNASSYSKLLKRKINSIYPDYKISYTPAKNNYQASEIDSNQVYFFAQLFFSDSVNQNMDREVSYKKIYTQKLKSKIAELEQVFKNTSELPNDSLEALYEKNMQYWYLFDNIYLANFNLTNSISHIEILRDRFNSDFREHHAVSLCVLMYPKSKSFFHKSVRSYTYFDKQIPFEYSDNYKTLFATKIMYSIPLRKSLSLFSHIELGFGYEYGSNESKNSEARELYSYSGTSAGKYIYNKCVFSREPVKYLNIFNAELSTPVWYFNKNIYLGLGCEVSYFSWKDSSKLDYNVRIDNLDTHTQEIQDKYIPFEDKESKTEVLPFVELHARFFENIDLIIRQNSKHFQAGLRYVFKLS